MSPRTIDRRGLAAGARSMVPLVVPAVPFGFVVGLAITESPISNLAGWSSSWLVFAGSSQLAAIQVLDEGAGVFLTAITIWVVNARHTMYSAALAGRFAEAPRWSRLLGAYVLVDQNFANIDPVDIERPIAYRISFLLGGGFTAWILWQIWVIVGIVAGDAIPASWSLDFAVPVMFLTLLILAINNLPGVIAAVVGGVVAVLAVDFPNGTGLLTGAVLGIIAGGTADWLLSRGRYETPTPPSTPSAATGGTAP